MSHTGHATLEKGPHQAVCEVRVLNSPQHRQFLGSWRAAFPIPHITIIQGRKALLPPHYHHSWIWPRAIFTTSSFTDHRRATTVQVWPRPPTARAAFTHYEDFHHSVWRCSLHASPDTKGFADILKWSKTAPKPGNCLNAGLSMQLHKCTSYSPCPCLSHESLPTA